MDMILSFPADFFEWFVAAFEKRAARSIQVEATRYVTGAIGVFLLTWVVLARPLAARRIREHTGKNKITFRQIRREMIYSALTVFVFMLMGILVFEGAAMGWFRFYSDIGTFGWPYLIFSIAALLVVHDAYFYWTHRLMHHPKLYKHFHKTHHKSQNPTPFTAYSFDPGEAMISFMIVPIYAFLIPLHDLATVIYLWIMIVRNALAHCGYELLPRGWARHRVLGVLTGVVHHDMHHERASGNYGFYFTFWDRVMGTEHHNYLERVDMVTRQLHPEPIDIAPALPPAE